MSIKKTIKAIPWLYCICMCVLNVLKRLVVTIKYCFVKSNTEIHAVDLIVLGTGPSLVEDFDAVKANRNGKKLMVVNSYCVDNNFELIRPEYYVLADPCYYVDNVSGVGKVDRDVFIETITKKLCWNITIVIPETGKNSFLVKKLSVSKYVSFEFVSGNCLYFPIGVNKFKSYNKNLVMPVCQNVLQMCLYYGIYKKFLHIYLYGADHNWCKDIFVSEDNVVCIEEKHCYVSEHHKIHAIEKVDGANWSMGELFDAWARVYKGYYEIREYAKYNRVRVFNCSSVSFIDAFERI